jgi:hypothetical protein
MSAFRGRCTNFLRVTSAKLLNNAVGGGIKNGDLLKRAEKEFQLFITSDQNLRYQQNLSGRQLAILELSTNDLRRIQAAADLIKSNAEKIQPREFRRLEIP